MRVRFRGWPWGRIYVRTVARRLRRRACHSLKRVNTTPIATLNPKACPKESPPSMRKPVKIATNRTNGPRTLTHGLRIILNRGTGAW